MADVYTTIASADVSVIGGPTSVNVAIDYGLKGDRGSLFLYGNGKPNEVTLPETPNAYDMYLNLNASDSEYRFVYQYINTPSGMDWVSIFKMVPDIYTTSKTLTFIDGQAVTYIPAVAVVGSSQRAASLLSSNYAVLATIVGDSPIASSISVGTTQTDSQNVISIPITVTAAKRNGNNTWSNLSGEMQVFFQITVI
jgi:hypothetical protein